MPPQANASQDSPQWNSEPAPNDLIMPYTWYLSAEYLHWWLRAAPTPALVTTATPPATGALGPGTTVLIGGNTFTNLTEDGYRLTLGTWCDCVTSIEASYFFANQGTSAFVSSSSFPVLARPFLNVNTGLEDAAQVAIPGLVSGSVLVLQDSQFWGAEVNVRKKHICNKHFNLDLLLGVRYLELEESLVINEDVAINPNVPVLGGLSALAHDAFATRNYFFGGQGGVEAEWDCGPFYVNARAKLALGATKEEVAIRGTTTQNVLGTTTVVPAGFLALGTNIGAHSRTQFSLAPEGGVNVGCIFTQNLRASIGYNVLYISDVVRPGNQIDRGINPAQGLPGSFGGAGGPAVPARPAFVFRESDFWVQGLSVSVEVRF
jgi:hypothetical protein